jgi:hypothetical protein
MYINQCAWYDVLVIPYLLIWPCGAALCFSHYLLDLHETIVEIGVELSGSGGSVLLGLLQILPLTAQQ